jgi:4-hydroxyacetophenone monooxygenase
MSVSIPADDATLAEYLESANLPALLPSIVQWTGDGSLLQRFPPPSPGVMGAMEGGFAPEDQAAIRAVALEALEAYFDGDGSLPPPPSHERLHDMMNWCAGEPVPSEYVPLAIEEAALVDPDPRRFAWRQRPDPAVLRDFHVLVIGAGFGGVCAAVRLEQAGIPYTICEKNDAVGGTWYENSYPDLRVDVPNHFYSYSFEPNPDWPDYYSRRDELEGYIGACARKHGIQRRVRFGTEVVSAEYEESSASWHVRVRREDGSEEVLHANAVISAVGMLNRPHIPSIDGLDSFGGPCFHSSRWQHEIDFEGKRVGVIGTGASAMQFAPVLASKVSKLTIFQRAAHWALPNPSYHSTVSEGFRWLLRHVPYYHSWYRFLLFWSGGDRVYPAFRIDPDWDDPENSTGPANAAFRMGAIEYMTDQLGGDAELMRKCLPDYPPMGKRPLLDNGWYRTLVRDNVELVTQKIRAVSSHAVITAGGAKHPLDVLVLATGFHAGRFLWPMQITGRGGVSLQDRWEEGENPRAHLGIAMPDFPNLFCMYGPNTNPVVGSVIFMLECQTQYIMGCLRALLESGHRSLECRKEVHDEYNERLDAELEKMVWRHPRVRSYYNNSAGRVITNVPWTMYEYWKMTRVPELGEYRVR